jgi:hypothetical protein
MNIKNRNIISLPLFTFCPPGPLLRAKVNVIKSKKKPNSFFSIENKIRIALMVNSFYLSEFFL